MEPPFKRRRLAGSSHPRIDLHARRAQNDFRLKSVFESIFEKYGRDFDGIGDEIDMETGEIVVNNGHIEGMANERDIGHAEYSSEKLGDSDQEDDHSLTEYSDENSAAPGSSKAGDGAVIEVSEASEQSDFDTDSLMGDVPADSHLHQFGMKSKRPVSIPLDDEADELAGSDIEWVSYNEDKLGVQERFNLLKNDFASLDEPAVESAWRAPPLPNTTRLEREREKVALTSVNNIREYSDDERAGVSLWTPEVQKRRRRRQADANSINRRSLPLAGGQKNSADGLLSDSSDSDPTPRKIVKWTQEEEDLLAHLKTTTDLSGPAMEAYFPERLGNAITCHWNFMITRGKASPNSPESTMLGHRIPLSSLSSSTSPLAPDGARPEPHDHDTTLEVKGQETVQQPMSRRSLEAKKFIQSSSRPISCTGDHHINSRCQVCGDFRTLVDEPIIISDDVGAHIGYTVSEQPSSTRNCNCKIVEPVHHVNLNECLADADQSYSVLEPFEDDDGSSMRGKDRAAESLDQGSELVSKNGCGVRVSSPTTSIQAEPDLKGAKPISDGIVSPEIHSQSTRAIETSKPPKRARRSYSETRRGESFHLTAENSAQREGSTAQGLQKTRSTNLVSTTPAQPTDRGKSSASRGLNVEITSNNSIKRQIVQVVIPLAPSSRPHVICPVAATETEDPAFIKQPSANAESAPAALGPDLPHQENYAICTPTRSPSVTAAESQYATSAAIVPDEDRTSLGPEIADSQPLSTIPLVAVPVLELGGDATRPIILDDESPPLTLSPSVVPSSGRQVQKANKTIVLECDSQPLRVTPVIATPAQKGIEEATESDILESGSYPLRKMLTAARSPSKRATIETIANTSCSIWTAIDDYSEDELSYF